MARIKSSHVRLTKNIDNLIWSKNHSGVYIPEARYVAISL